MLKNETRQRLVRLVNKAMEADENLHSMKPNDLGRYELRDEVVFYVCEDGEEAKDFDVILNMLEHYSGFYCCSAEHYVGSFIKPRQTRKGAKHE